MPLITLKIKIIKTIQIKMDIEPPIMLGTESNNIYSPYQMSSDFLALLKRLITSSLTFLFSLIIR